MAKSPIGQPLDALAKGSPPPFDWIVEHAVDGTLRQPWKRSIVGTELLWLYAFTRDKRGLAQATTTCVRSVGMSPRIDPEYVRVFEAVGRWSRGDLSQEELVKAGDKNWTILNVVFLTDPHGSGAAASTAVHWAMGAQITSSMSGKRVDAMFEKNERKLAKLVRHLLPCPTLEQVLSRD